jgi:hypothetical protein
MIKIHNNIKNPMKLLSVVILYLLPIQLFGQLRGTYDLENELKPPLSKDNLSTSIVFSNSSDYLIRCTHKVGDGYAENILSFGQYELKSKDIILREAVNKFNMVMEYKDSILIVKKGMPFMEGRKFNHLSDDTYHYLNDLEDLKKQNLFKYYKERKERYLKSHQVDYLIHTGSYLLKTNSGIPLKERLKYDYHLKIIENHNYIYYLGNMVLSKGDWEQEKALVIFQDKMLNYKFNMLVKNDSTLIHNGAPGLYTNKYTVLFQIEN